MYIRKHGAKWQCYIRYKGMRIGQSFTLKSSAIKWASKTLSELQEGTFKNRDKLFKMKLRELLTLYADKYRNKYRSKSFEFAIRVINRSNIGSCHLAYLDGVRLSKFRDLMLETRSSSTVRKYLLLISRAINIGTKELGIPFDHNPISMISLPTDPEHRDRVLSQEEKVNLFEACDDSRLFCMRSIVELAIETLCRRGEIFSLNYKDCDLTLGQALVRFTKNGKSRKIGLSPRAIEIIKSLPRTVDGKLFSVESISSFAKEFVKCLSRAGIRDFHFHDLRHTGATYLAMQGWTTLELMQQGGWSSAEMVSRYANIGAKHLAERLKAKHK
jgi:integrase